VKDLNDFRFVAAVAESGSLAGAARRLQVDHATAFRRLGRIQARLGVRLFERHSGRYTPTAAGEELARLGATMEAQATESLRRLAGQDLRPAGTVRITTTESIAGHLIGPVAYACRREHPAIHLQIVTANEIYNLSKRDADIAVRPTLRPPDHLIGHRTGSVGLAVYGARKYVGRGRIAPDLSHHCWIALDDSLSQTASLRWLDKIKSLDTVELRVNSFPGIYHACRSGLGLAVLPCFIGDADPDLRRLGEPIPECEAALWVLTHPDLRGTVRVQAVFDVLQRELKRQAPRLAGQRSDTRRRG